LSSILRALKKLENDPRHLEENPPLDSKFVPLADTGSQNTAGRLLMVVFGGGIVCGLVVLAGWWLFSAKTEAPPAAPQIIADQGPQQTETAPVKPEGSGPPAGSTAALGPEQPAADVIPLPDTNDPLPEPISAKTGLPPSPAINPEALVPVTGQAADSVIQVPAAPEPEIIEQAPAEEIAAVSETTDFPIQSEKLTFPVLKDPDMKLQAITWSKDPQKRIAVINNRIVRQGDAVSGYRIDVINQDDVVLSDAGEKWHLLFRIR